MYPLEILNLVSAPISNKGSGQCTYQKSWIWSVHLSEIMNLESGSSGYEYLVNVPILNNESEKWTYRKWTIWSVYLSEIMDLVSASIRNKEFGHCIYQISGKCTYQNWIIWSVYLRERMNLVSVSIRNKETGHWTLHKNWIWSLDLS